MNSDRGGCRHEDCRIPLDRNFSPTPPAEPSVVGRCGSATATPNFSIRNAAASITPPLLASRWRARLRCGLTGNHPLLFFLRKLRKRYAITEPPMPSRGSPNSARRSSRTNATLHPPRSGSLPLHLPPHGHHFIKRLQRDPTPGPDVRTADAQTPLWPGVNLSTRSAFCRSR